jgi:hypothetical protein
MNGIGSREIVVDMNILVFMISFNNQSNEGKDSKKTSKQEQSISRYYLLIG